MRWLLIVSVLPKVDGGKYKPSLQKAKHKLLWIGTTQLPKNTHLKTSISVKCTLSLLYFSVLYLAVRQPVLTGN